MVTVRKLVIISDESFYQIYDAGSLSKWLSQEELDELHQPDLTIKEVIALTELPLIEITRLQNSQETTDQIIYKRLELEKRLPNEQQSTSGYFFSLLSGVAHQVKAVADRVTQPVTEMAGTVYTVFDKVRKASAGIGVVNTLILGTRTLLDADKRSAVIALGSQYIDYKNKIAQGQKSHVYVQTESDKLLSYLHEKGSKRSAQETARYHQLLENAYMQENKQIEAQFTRARALIDGFKEITSIPLDVNACSREHIQAKMEALQMEYSAAETLSIDDFSVIEMAVSKILLMNNDALRKQTPDFTPKKNIGILIPVHKEHNRIQPKSKCYTGEDFLARKLRQLYFLFDGIETVDWHVTFVDDEAKSSSSHRSIDEIQKRMREDITINHLQSKVTCLDYEADLREEQNAYKNPELRALSPDELAKKSVKGAAIHLGMRYFCHSAPYHEEFLINKNG